MASQPVPAAESVLVLENVSKSFHTRERTVRALQDVGFEVGAAKITGLIGPDGAGKTTLMRLAAGLLEPDAGALRVLGLDATEQSLAVQSSVGYMPQRFGLYEDLSVRENLDLYADLQGVPHEQREGRYAQLMRMTGLAQFTERLAGRLSGGMKQKLGLACTLVRSPRLLLLDEPTVGVDPVSRRELWSIIDRLVADEGVTVMMSTAYLDEAERCSDVVLLHEGEVLGQGAPHTFSEPLEGQTYVLHTGGSPRRLQARLQDVDCVMDVVVSGGRVRLVMEKGSGPGVLPDDVQVERVEPVAPRFEDAFVALLQQRKSKRAGGLKLIREHGSRLESGPVIAVQNLSRRFGDFYAVKNITFEVNRGEVFGLLGANGAGKSTTFRMLCGLLPASGGHLQVAGMDLRVAAAEARARIGYMSQKFSLYGILSVRQNLEFFAQAYGLRNQQRTERIDWAMEQFELRDVAAANSEELSLGYKQRLAMSCALMHEPDILFLDEPTSGVDPLARREFWQRINALASAGVTVMVTTHFMEEAEYCDRIAIMAAGEILTLGTPAAIKRHAQAEGAEEPTLEDAFIQLIQAHEEVA